MQRSGVLLLFATTLLLQLQRLAAEDEGDLMPVGGGITVYFVNIGGAGGKLFSRKLRGEMMADELRKQRPDWGVYWVTIGSLELNIPKIRNAAQDSHVVCIFVKGYNKEYGSMCQRELNAVVLHDTVDNLQFLQHADNAEFLRENNIDAMIVQTAEKATEARRAGLSAHYLPHHHTNFANIHRTAETMTGRVKTLAFLSGSPLNTPPRRQMLSIANTACMLGVQLLLIEQGLKLPLETSVTKFSCLSNRTVGTIRRSSSVDKDEIPAGSDPYQQIYHHRHPIFQEVDIALLWPPSFNHRPTIELRPPTRLLFWMSHGVPVIFYPYVAYLEVSTEHHYYQECIADSRVLYNITDSGPKLAAALQLLVGEDKASIRQCLSRKGRRIVEQYSATALGASYAKSIEGIFQQ